jgi:hypothetical protein
MSSGDFEAQLQQSVQGHVALIQAAAQAAKTRIVQSVETLVQPQPAFEPAPPASQAPPRPRAAVNFDVEEPAFDDTPIAFDGLSAQNVDDEGIPVWEDAP